MTRLLVDTSVVIKWFHSEGESEVDEARAVLRGHAAGELEAHLLDLGAYEIGNVLTRALRWPWPHVTNQLDDLRAILGPGLGMSAAGWRHAAEIAATHDLTFYDASWAAAAQEFAMPLVSADKQLLKAGLAESPTAVQVRLRLT